MTPLTGVLVIVQSVLLFVVAQQLYQFRVTLPPYELYADRGMVRINAAVFKVSSWFGLTPTLVPPAAGGLMSPVNIAPELDCDTLFYRYNITCRSPVATEVFVAAIVGYSHCLGSAEPPARVPGCAAKRDIWSERFDSRSVRPTVCAIWGDWVV